MGARGSLGRIGVLAALAVVVLAQGASSQTPAPAPVLAPDPAAPPLLRAVPIGSAVRLASLQSGGRYRATFLREFDSLTPENEMKMQALQPRRGTYDFAASDELVRFAHRNGKAVRGHTLIWGQALPLWIVDHGALEKVGLRLPPIVLPALPNPLGKLVGDTAALLTGWRRDELMEVMKAHIRTVMLHYKGEIGEWDVVNEPIADDGSLAATVWRRFIGPDYVEQALRTARTADPQAKLFINDYAVEFPGPKLDGLVRLATDLVARGVPLDGIGLQSHTHIAGYSDEATLTRVMRRFTRLGLEVQITELDVGTSLLEASRPERLQRQALAYGEVARACNAVVQCTRLTTWGFTDAVSWLSAGEAGLLFDGKYRAKPAYTALRASFAPRPAPVVAPPP